MWNKVIDKTYANPITDLMSIQTRRANVKTMASTLYKITQRVQGECSDWFPNVQKPARRVLRRHIVADASNLNATLPLFRRHCLGPSCIHIAPNSVSMISHVQNPPTNDKKITL